MAVATADPALRTAHEHRGSFVKPDWIGNHCDKDPGKHLVLLTVRQTPAVPSSRRYGVLGKVNGCARVQELSRPTGEAGSQPQPSPEDWDSVRSREDAHPVQLLKQTEQPRHVCADHKPASSAQQLQLSPKQQNLLGNGSSSRAKPEAM